MPRLLPMLADAATERQVATGLFVSSDDWLLQVKIDGERRVVICDGDGAVTALARDGEPTGLPAPIRRVLEQVNVPVVLDGEIVAGTFCVWEAIRFGDQINERSRCLDRVTAGFAIVQALGSDRILFVPTALHADEKIAMIERVIDGRGEGTMAKLCASPYDVTGKRSRAWRKVKRMHTIDCVVDWLGDEKENMGLVLFDEHGSRVDVGECGRAVGDGRRVKEGDVVEVRVLNVTASGKLYQPNMPRIRTDKRPDECTTDQLASAYTDKNLILHWAA